MFCKYCGKELPNYAIFCSQCGKKLDHQKNHVIDEEAKAEELFNKASEFAQNNNYADAVPFFEKAAELGNEAAISSLAMIYIDGKGISPDYEKGLKYLHKSVNNGNPFSINYLGTLYLEGKCVPKDYEQAFISFNIAADKKFPYALLNLAECYEKGYGTEKDIDSAMDCYFQIVMEDFDEVIKETAICELRKHDNIPYVYSFLSDIIKDYKKSTENLAIGSFNELMDAAYNNSIKDVVRLIAEGADINELDDSDNTPLMWSALNNCYDIAKILISSGAKIDLKNSLGYTALYMAVNGQDLDIMKLLIEHGANVNEKDNCNTTILMNAVNENFVEGVKLLLEHNADISPVDDLNRSAFTIAEEFNETEIIDLLNNTKSSCSEDNSAELYKKAQNCISLDNFEKSDFKQYRELLEKAANAGYAPAQYELGKNLEVGTAGFEKDIEKAKEWLEKAAKQGHKGAIYSLE